MTAPIEMPVTATGVNPVRLSFSTLSTPYFVGCPQRTPALQYDRGVHLVILVVIADCHGETSRRSNGMPDYQMWQ